ncbi:glycosyltransferase family 39 protein [Streptomyces sp. 7R007]
MERKGRREGVVAVAVPTAVMSAVGLWGLDRGGMWGDESVTYLVGRRSVPQIWRLLHGMDAVHGLYYLFMHAVLAVHPGEVVLRLPSVCGAAAAAGLVAALGVRLARPRVGLWAGLLYAVTPLTGHYAQEGRSYALVAAGVAGATLLLVRGVEGRGRWWGYGGVLAVSCLLHELAVLVVCAHAVTLVLCRASRRVWLGWGCAVTAAGAALAPLVWVSRRQSGQVAWLAVPGWGRVEALARDFAVAPRGVVFWAAVVLMAVGAVAGRRVAVVAGPLLVVPPGVLMAVSQVRPLYHERYVLYALAGAPLLVAAGGEWAVGLLRRGRRVAALDALPNGASHGHLRLSRLPVLAGALAIALVFLHALPLYRQDRSPAHRPENLAAVSALAAREIRPGDPVLFVPSVWRLTALTYPRAFRAARDIALREPGPRSGTLSGRETPPRELPRELRRRLASADRVWVVADTRALHAPGDPTDRLKLAALQRRFTPGQEYVSGRVALRLYVRRAALTGSPAQPGPPRPTVTAPPPRPRPAPR